MNASALSNDAKVSKKRSFLQYQEAPSQAYPHDMKGSRNLYPELDASA